jgi:hypothetical protein
VKKRREGRNERRTKEEREKTRGFCTCEKPIVTLMTTTIPSTIDDLKSPKAATECVNKI